MLKSCFFFIQLTVIFCPTSVVPNKVHYKHLLALNFAPTIPLISIFLQGVVPTAQRAATVAGVELPAYDLCKKVIVQSGYLGDTKPTHFL